MDYFIFSILSILGAIAGSTLSAWIWRTRTAKSMLRGRSMCPQCGHVLGVVDLLPILGFLLRRGKCAYCKAKISGYYFSVELFLAVMFPVLFFWYGETWMFLRAAVLLFFLTAIFVYDARYMEVPDRFSITAIILMLLISPLSVYDWAVGAVVCGGFFAVQYIVSGGRWIGGGDIRIGVLMGVVLGWQVGVFAILLSYVVGGLYGSYLLVSKKASAKSQIPFGTFLTFSILVAFVFGKNIVSWYFGLL